MRRISLLFFFWRFWVGVGRLIRIINCMSFGRVTSLEQMTAVVTSTHYSTYASSVAAWNASNGHSKRRPVLREMRVGSEVDRLQGECSKLLDANVRLQVCLGVWGICPIAQS